MPNFEDWRRDAVAESTNSQGSNEHWWENHPMDYDWRGERAAEPGSREFFRQIDQEFFAALEHVAHPGWPQCLPFSALENFTRYREKEVLEIGCGFGSLAEVLVRSGCNLTAIDLTQRAVDMTGTRLELNGLTAKVLKMDAERMEFPSATFDFVWSWGVIHHSSCTEQIVREIYRVLKPGGRFAIMVYHRNSTRYWINGVLRRGILRGELLRKSMDQIQMDFTDGFYARHFSRPQLRRLFEAFSIEEVRTVDIRDSVVPFGRLRHLLKKFLSKTQYWALIRWIEARFGWEIIIRGHKR